jgi:hypothetical protein
LLQRWPECGLKVLEPVARIFASDEFGDFRFVLETSIHHRLSPPSLEFGASVARPDFIGKSLCRFDTILRRKVNNSLTPRQIIPSARFSGRLPPSPVGGLRVRHGRFLITREAGAKLARFDAVPIFRQAPLLPARRRGGAMTWWPAGPASREAAVPVG